ncbi:TFS1 [Candida margitis]|uniref:TFS1 n=1 Tax=Candida margitis TaxID=1775924 RepID=UPI0022265335|nr:TFS1 [Candida margitis]KAI5967174.1 TFS1 [Candida margitis]
MLNKLSSTAILKLPIRTRAIFTTQSLLKSITVNSTIFTRSLFYNSHFNDRRYKQTPAKLTSLTSKMTLITISQSLDEAFTKNKIVPDVVDDFETQGLLSIEYGPTELVTLGNTLPVSGTQEPPKIQLTLNSPTEDGKIESINEGDKFILVLTDPDAPSNTDHKWSEYLHWLVTDIELPHLKTESGEPEISHFIDASQGKEVFKYEGPGPPPKTGKHRYVFLLFKQDPKIITFEAPKDRPNWGTGTPSSGVRDFINAQAPGSKLLAVNFFYAQNEDN